MLPQVLPRTSGLLDPYAVVDGVLARLDVADAAAVLAVLAGPDPDDPWSRVGHPRSVLARPRLALADGLDFAGDTAMAAAFDRVAGRAARRAQETVRVSIDPFVEAGDLLYTGSPEPVSRPRRRCSRTPVRPACS